MKGRAVQVGDRTFAVSVKPHVMGHLDRFTSNVCLRTLLLPAHLTCRVSWAWSIFWSIFWHACAVLAAEA